MNDALGPQFTIKINNDYGPMTILVGANSSSLNSITKPKTVDVEVVTTVAVGAFRAVGYDGAYTLQNANSLSNYAGVTKVAYSIGVDARLVRVGSIIESSWTWTVNGPIFITGNGTLTQTPGSIPLRRIGWAMSATQINFDPFPIIGA